MATLILALLFSTLIMVSFKLFERFRINTIQAITTNYLVAVLCGILMLPVNISPAEMVALPWFHFGVIIGVFFILVFFVFATSARKVGIAITAVSSKMSVIIPVIAGVVLIKNDTLTILKALGIITALIAFYLTFRKKGPVNIRKRWVILPILLFLGNGTNDTLQSYVTNIYGISKSGQVPVLLIIVFTTALCIGILVVAYQRIFLKIRTESRNILAGIVLGLLNYFSTYFFLLTLDKLPNSVFFPVFNAGIVTLSALTGFFVFREKLRPINWAGIALAIAAIVIIAFADSM
jgi:multidrug transporter EmrE-like cation transporter